MVLFKLLRTGSLALALGALTTVLVAVACSRQSLSDFAIFSPITTWPPPTKPQQSRAIAKCDPEKYHPAFLFNVTFMKKGGVSHWRAWAESDPSDLARLTASAVCELRDWTSDGRYLSPMGYSGESFEGLPGASIDVYGFGWPLPAMYSMYTTGGNQSPPYAPREPGWDYVIDARLKTPGLNVRQDPLPGVPTGVLWGRFAADSGFFGTLWWVALIVPPKFRAHIRRRRGFCPHCAYDLRGLGPGEKCPECGRSPRH